MGGGKDTAKAVSDGRHRRVTAPTRVAGLGQACHPPSPTSQQTLLAGGSSRFQGKDFGPFTAKRFSPSLPPTFSFLSV